MGLIRKRLSETGVAGEVFPMLNAYELCCGDAANASCDYEGVVVLPVDQYLGSTITSYSYLEDGVQKFAFLKSPILIGNPEAIAEAMNETLPELGYYGQFSVLLEDVGGNYVLTISANSDLELLAYFVDGGDTVGFAKNCADGFPVTVLAFNDRDASTGGTPLDQKKQANEPFVENVLMILYNDTTGLEAGYAYTDVNGSATFEGVLPGGYSVAFQEGFAGGDGFGFPVLGASTEPRKKLEVQSDGTVVLDSSTTAQWVDAPLAHYPLSEL